jgi:hypothetical protein
MAKELLFGKLKNGGKVTINAKDNKIVLETTESMTSHTA